MIIPREIIVGYQNRNESFGNRLGFITAMYDGKMKFENAFKSWVKIDPDTFTNEPTSGFVVNFANPCSYGDREAFIRMWDPRGFEFEITLDNFMMLLLNNSMEEGGVLKGEFIYGWVGTISKRVTLIDPKKLDNYDIHVKVSNDFVKRFTSAQIIKEVEKKKTSIDFDKHYAILVDVSYKTEFTEIHNIDMLKNKFNYGHKYWYELYLFEK